MFDTPRIERGRTPHNPVYFISFFYQKLGKERTVLTGDAGDQAALHRALGGVEAIGGVGSGGAARRQHGAVVVPVDGAGVHHVRGRGGGRAAVSPGRAGSAGSDVQRGAGGGGGVVGDEERDDERREHGEDAR